MTLRRITTLTAVAALVAAAAAVLVALVRAGLDTPSPVAAAAPAITDSTWPFPSPTAASRSAAPAVKPAVEPAGTTPPAVAPAASPAPFVQHFADGATASPLPAKKSPTAPVKVPAFADGCDHNYGTPTQCVPLTFPAGVTDACSWLAAHGFTDLKVAGRDVQNLDPDGDGTACN
ncbi:hypothetical protein GCM10010168_44380 [Actinoplanes ianthinogenes]|uniref:Excalibur calcium-binding domain-containing protein n=1 Tax=Actinoplanes ianthinogenes TaxID=122358 RepID=A0ABN6C777_9ACTN|nr:hypothetical protein [Actinoplanes ianthinogenes]BCJ41264.1 hypothetical protein Aiant_19210 [Actinoplanes ianthinogenes]GGR21811.1 hypothetical protein GCM10010168_44380 [Actinoplanes ianthinogenes]